MVKPLFKLKKGSQRYPLNVSIFFILCSAVSHLNVMYMSLSLSVYTVSLTNLFSFSRSLTEKEIPKRTNFILFFKMK